MTTEGTGANSSLWLSSSTMRQRRESQLTSAGPILDAALAVLDCSLVEAKQRNGAILATTRQRQIDHEEEMRRRWAYLESMYRMTMDRMAASEQSRAQEISSLRGQITQREEAEQAILGAIRTQLTETEAAQRVEREAMVSRVETLENSHRMEVESMKREGRGLQSEINQLKTEHGVLKNSVRDGLEREQRIEEQLSAAQALNAKHEAQLESDRAEMSRLQSEASNLRDEMSDKPLIRLFGVELF